MWKATADPLKEFLFGLLFLDLYREINKIHRQTWLSVEVLVSGDFLGLVIDYIQK
jgi:hypothetical protein